MALITAVFPSSQRGTAIGFLETSVSIAFTIAPTLGGFLQTIFGWRAVFYVNVPIAAAGFTLAYLVVADPPRDGRRRPLDLTGAALLSIGLAGLMLALTRGFADEPSAPFFRWFLIPGLIALILFVRVQRRIKDPTIDLSLFSNRVFAGANTAKVFSYAVFSMVTFLMPFYLEIGLGLSPTLTGLGMTAYPVALAIGSMVGGPLSDRVGSHVLAPTGMVFAAFGAFWLTQVQPSGGYVAVMIPMILVGLGMGLFIVPNDSAIMGASPADKLGVASGILATTRSLGLTSGVALSGTLLAAGLQAYQAAGTSASGIGNPAFTLAYHPVYFVSIAFCAVAFALSLFRGKAGHG